jgi:signal peptidase I
MRAQGWAGAAGEWLPVGWPANDAASPARDRKSIAWRRIVFGKNPRRTLQRVLCWASCSIVFFNYCLVPIKVTGASMTPTYRDGSVNFINRLSYTRKIPRRGDVVILRDSEDLILKRVIGLPGETVSLHQGRFYINGVALCDRFSDQTVNWEFDDTTLKKDQFFVIGDNRTYSIFGVFDREQILGKIFF